MLSGMITQLHRVQIQDIERGEKHSALLHGIFTQYCENYTIPYIRD